MKYTIEAEQKAFEPVTITITLESLEELKSMWVRMSKPNVWDDDREGAKGAYLDAFPIWDELDDLLTERTE